jgi:hypothetical protein
MRADNREMQSLEEMLVEVETKVHEQTRAKAAKT